MDDYFKLRGYGTAHSFDETVVVQDKGHKNLITQFFEGIQKESWENPLNVNRLNTVAKLTLIVDQLVCQGGGEQNIVQK